MKKHTFFALIFFIVLIFSTSCKNVFNKIGSEQNEGEGSLTIYLPGAGVATRAASRTDIYSSQIETYYLTINGETLSAPAGGTITFEALDAGTYTLTGYAVDSSNKHLASGSTRATVNAGETNTVSFALSTVLPMAVWSRVWSSNDSAYIYTYSLTDTEMGTLKTFTADTAAYSELVAFDGYRNLYVGGSAVPLSVYSSTSGYTTPTSIPYDGTNISPIAMYHCPEDGLMYIAESDTLYICDTETQELTPVEEETSESSVFTYLSDFPFMAVTPFSADGTAYLYVAEMGNNVPVIYTFEITNTDGNYTISAMTDLYSTDNPTFVAATTYAEETGLTLTPYGSSNVTDLAISGNYLYVLINYTASLFMSNGFYSYNNLSTGALIRYDISTGRPVYDSNFGKVGWTDKITKMFTITDSNDSTCTAYLQCPSDATERSAFYGPIKILAIKPKRIWIADEGANIDISGGTPVTSDNIVQKDRVAEINLETRSFEYVYTNSDVTFDSEIAGSGF